MVSEEPKDKTVQDGRRRREQSNKPGNGRKVNGWTLIPEAGSLFEWNEYQVGGIPIRPLVRPLGRSGLFRFRFVFDVGLKVHVLGNNIVHQKIDQLFA